MSQSSARRLFNSYIWFGSVKLVTSSWTPVFWFNDLNLHCKKLSLQEMRKKIFKSLFYLTSNTGTWYVTWLGLKNIQHYKYLENLNFGSQTIRAFELMSRYVNIFENLHLLITFYLKSTRFRLLVIIINLVYITVEVVGEAATRGFYEKRYS